MPVCQFTFMSRFTVCFRLNKCHPYAKTKFSDLSFYISLYKILKKWKILLDRNGANTFLLLTCLKYISRYKVKYSAFHKRKKIFLNSKKFPYVNYSVQIHFAFFSDNLYTVNYVISSGFSTSAETNYRFLLTANLGWSKCVLSYPPHGILLL